MDALLSGPLKIISDSHGIFRNLLPHSLSPLTIKFIPIDRLNSLFNQPIDVAFETEWELTPRINLPQISIDFVT